MTQHLDQNQLAARWRMSPRTLEQWRWQGRGPRYLKIGGRVVYRLADVEAFEAASIRVNTTGPIAPATHQSPAHAGEGSCDRTEVGP
jgi:Helix-turn-helix domain